MDRQTEVEMEGEREEGMETLLEGGDGTMKCRECRRRQRQEEREVEVSRMCSFPVACLPADVKRKWLDQQGAFTCTEFSCGNTCVPHVHIKVHGPRDWRR